MGKFRNVLLNQTSPVEAVIRNIASNVTVVIFQVHAQQSDVVISFDKVRVSLLLSAACLSTKDLALVHVGLMD